MKPNFHQASDTISRMLKSNELQHPELYFIIQTQQNQYGQYFSEIMKKYRIKFISIKKLLESRSQRKDSSSQDEEESPFDIIKLILRKIRKLGNRKYVIQGFPNSIEQLDSFKKKLKSLQVQFKGFFNFIRQSNDKNLKDNTKFDQLIKFASSQNLLININFSKISEISLNFQKILIQIGFKVPPLIPIICILGGPGSGKGTNCASLVRDYGFRHISTGDLLRNYNQQGQWYKVINELMIQGKLVPSDIVLEIVKQEIDRYNYQGVYLLDGFPRNQQNMIVWNKIMTGFAEVQLYLYLECDNQTLQHRLLNMRQDSGRCDDTPQIIKKRIKTFETVTIPFINNILKNELVIRIDSRPNIQTVYQNIQQQFKKEGIMPNVKSYQKPSIIFILGGPGAGKGTQCQLLTNQYGFRHLSTGDLLRLEIKNNGPEAKSIQSYIDEGKLVPSTVLVKLMRNKIENQGWKGRYLVDGFPRGVENIKAWYTIMGDDVHVDALLFFECSMETMESRLLKRGQTSGRSDDNPAAIKKRFVTYINQTQPFLQFYRNSGGKIHRINTDRPVQIVSQALKELLNRQKLL